MIDRVGLIVLHVHVCIMLKFARLVVLARFCNNLTKDRVTLLRYDYLIVITVHGLLVWYAFVKDTTLMSV